MNFPDLVSVIKEKEVLFTEIYHNFKQIRHYKVMSKFYKARNIET